MNDKGPAPKVSVIVPIYNCAPFLPVFFRDMGNQSFCNFEMICVIDGATDNSLEIVKNYAAEDNRIQYFYKENGGAGTARNYGLKFARGEYVIWLDADDRYLPELLKEMVSAADRFTADEVLCLGECHNHLVNKTIQNWGFNTEDFPENTCVNPSDVPNLFQKIGTGPNNKMYRRTFVEENCLQYSNTRVANDARFFLTAITVAKKVVGVHKHLIIVERQINPESITSNRGKYSEDVFVTLSEIYQWLKDKNLFEKYRETFYIRFVNAFLYNAEFGVNPKYVKAAVHMLNEEEPWASLRPEEIEKLFGKRWDINWIKGKIKNLENMLLEKESTSDPGIRFQLERWRSRLEVVALVKVLSNVRYNRDFDRAEIIRTKRQLRRLKKELEEAKYQIQRERNSWNFKIGSIITWMPKKLYYLFKNNDAG